MTIRADNLIDDGRNPGQKVPDARVSSWILTRAYSPSKRGDADDSISSWISIAHIAIRAVRNKQGTSRIS